MKNHAATRTTDITPATSFAPDCTRRTNFDRSAFVTEDDPIVATYGRENLDRIKKAILSFPPFSRYDHERVVREASAVYGIENVDRIKKAILSFPPFSGLNHERVVREASAVYGPENVDRIKKVILAFPQFGGYDHERVVHEASTVYGPENLDRIKKAILTFPQFTGYDHERVVRDTSAVYGLENVDRIKNTILSFPSFSGLNHERVVRDASAAYGPENVDRIKTAILSFPAFSAYDHERVVWQKTRLARLIGMTETHVIQTLLKRPVVAGYSFRRDLAWIDIGRSIVAGNPTICKTALRDSILSAMNKSPYWPDRTRISHHQVTPGNLQDMIQFLCRSALKRSTK